MPQNPHSSKCNIVPATEGGHALMFPLATPLCCCTPCVRVGRGPIF